MFYKILHKFKITHPVLSIFQHLHRSPNLEQASTSGLECHNFYSCLCSSTGSLDKSYDLAIIIPAYNEEKNIKRCIDSVLNQKTTFNYQCIIVDDGSCDRTGQIIDTYVCDKRVTIKHQENLGLSGARNTGIRISKAKYLMFLDSDDSLPQNAVQLLMSCAFEQNAAIVEGAFNSTNTNGKVVTKHPHKAGKLNPREDFFGFACMKVFISELFDGICFPEGYWYEDSIMAQIIYPLAEARNYTCFGIADTIYNYTINPSGITQAGRSNPKCIDSIWITLQLYKCRNALGLKTDQKYYEYILSMIALSYRRTELQPDDIKKSIFVLWREFIETEFTGFLSSDSCKNILAQAVRDGNYRLYTLCCKLL